MPQFGELLSIIGELCHDVGTMQGSRVHGFVDELMRLPTKLASGFSVDIDKATKANPNYRKVIYTAGEEQLALMSLPPGGDIGVETHPSTDQFIRVESGRGKSVMNGKEHPLKDGTAVVVPAGTKHNIVNTGTTPLKLYTVYSDKQHPDGIVEKTKEDAMKKEGALLKLGRVLSARGRRQIKGKNFALPGGRYPIHDKAHARNALSRVAQHGTPEERAQVRAAVAAKYPGIGKSASPSSRAIAKMIKETLEQTAPKMSRVKPRIKVPKLKKHTIPGSQKAGNPVWQTQGEFTTRFGAGKGLGKRGAMDKEANLKRLLFFGGALPMLAYGAYKSGDKVKGRPHRLPRPSFSRPPRGDDRAGNVIGEMLAKKKHIEKTSARRAR